MSTEKNPIILNNVKLAAMLYVRMAFQDVELGKAASAIEKYDNAIHLWPDSACVHYLRGDARRIAFGLDKRAQEDFDRARELGHTMAAKELCWWALLELEADNPKIAVDYATVALKLDPTVVQAYVVRGKANYALGYKTRALSDFDTANRLGWSSVATV